MDREQIVLAAFGNPLWDVCVSLPDISVLSQFHLADDSSKEVTAPEFESLLRAVKEYPRKGCPGGAALNTLRIFHWLDQKQSSVFFGSIGNDSIGKQLTNQISSEGVNARLKTCTDLLTGSAISLIYNDSRTLVAHLGAADIYLPEDFTEEDKKVISEVSIVYIENFFLSHSADVIWDVVKLCKLQGVAIVFNLSGAYLFEGDAKNITSLVKYANIVIGNESEYEALAKACNWNHSEIHDLASEVCNSGIQAPSTVTLNLKATKLENLRDWKKVVLITRGSQPVLCAAEGKSVFETSVLKPKFGVKDTTGAGDAFVAGFLKGIIQSFPLELCVQLGCYSSSEIIQQIGCNPPNYASKIENIVRNFAELRQTESGKEDTALLI